MIFNESCLHWAVGMWRFLHTINTWNLHIYSWGHEVVAILFGGSNPYIMWWTSMTRRQWWAERPLLHPVSVSAPPRLVAVLSRPPTLGPVTSPASAATSAVSSVRSETWSCCSPWPSWSRSSQPAGEFLLSQVTGEKLYNLRYNRLPRGRGGVGRRSEYSLVYDWRSADHYDYKLSQLIVGLLCLQLIKLLTTSHWGMKRWRELETE